MVGATLIQVGSSACSITVPEPGRLSQHQPKILLSSTNPKPSNAFSVWVSVINLPDCSIPASLPEMLPCFISWHRLQVLVCLQENVVHRGAVAQ